MMVCKAKTFSDAGGAYEAPLCKVYSITVESVIATSGTNNPGNGYDPGHDIGELGEDD